MKVFLKILWLIIFIFSLNDSYSVDQYSGYFNENYPEIKKIYDKYQNPNIKKLILKIIQEGKIKNIPPSMIEEFLKYEKKNLKILDKWINKYKIKEVELVDNIFELLRNDFPPKILTFILEKKEKNKNFREKFAKTLFFYIDYISHDLLDDALKTEDEYDFKNHDIALIAYSVYQTNPSLQYLNELIDMIQKLKVKKIDINHSTQIIYKKVISKTQPSKILESIKEIPED